MSSAQGWNSGNGSKIRLQDRYWRLVQSVRALITFPFVAAAFVVVADLIAGRQDTMQVRLATVVIGTCIMTSLSGLILTVLSLQRIRRDLRGPADTWISAEIRQFIKDVISLRRRGR